jgi:hypothetical protein
VTSTDRLFRRLLWALAAFAVVLGLIAAATGNLIAGQSGLVSGLIGAGIAFVFCGLTVVSVIVGRKVGETGFYAAILGFWALKAIVLLIAALLLRGQDFIHSPTLLVTIIVGGLGSVVIDTWMVLVSRQPIVELESSSGAKSATTE